MINYVLFIIILLIITVSLLYIYKSKKNGKKCIGCPDSCSCSHKSK